MTTAPKDNPLQAVEITKARKSPKEAEIERLASLGIHELSVEDIPALLSEIERDCRSSLLDAEREKEELKERLKLRKAALDDAIQKACDHFENRQMCLAFKELFAAYRER